MATSMVVTVALVKVGVQRRVQVDSQATVDGLVAQLRAEMVPLDIGGANYAVFVPADGGGHWLGGDVAVGDYADLIGQMTVELRCTERTVRVLTMDGVVRVLPTYYGVTVTVTLGVLAAELGLPSADDWRLVLPSAAAASNNARLLGIREQPDTVSPRAHVRQLWDFGQDTWLPIDQSLEQLGVGPNELLVLKRVPGNGDFRISVADPNLLRLVAHQAMREVCAGMFAVTLAQARELAVWVWYIQGLLGSALHLLPAKSAVACLPAVYRHAQSDRQHCTVMVPRCGQVAQSQFEPLDAMECFLRKLRPIADYGSRYFEVMERRRGKRPGNFSLYTVAFGISSQAVIVVHPKKREVLHQFPLTSLRRWASTAVVLALDFGDHQDRVQVYFTPKAREVGQVLFEHTQHLFDKQLRSIQLAVDAAMANDDNNEEAHGDDYGRHSAAAPIRPNAWASTVNSRSSSSDALASLSSTLQRAMRSSRPEAVLNITAGMDLPAALRHIRLSRVPTGLDLRSLKQEIDLISLTWAVETSLADLGSADFSEALTLSRSDARNGGSTRTATRRRASWTDLRQPLLVALAQLAHEVATMQLTLVRAQTEPLPLPDLVTCVSNIGQLLEQAVLAVRQIRSAASFNAQPLPALTLHVKEILDSVLHLLATLPGPGDVRLRFGAVLQATETVGGALRGVIVAVNMVPPSVLSAAVTQHADILQQKATLAVYDIRQVLRQGRASWTAAQATATADACDADTAVLAVMVPLVAPHIGAAGAGIDGRLCNLVRGLLKRVLDRFTELRIPDQARMTQLMAAATQAIQLLSAAL